MLQTMLHGELIILLRAAALNWMCAEKGPAENLRSPFVFGYIRCGTNPVSISEK